MMSSNGISDISPTQDGCRVTSMSEATLRHRGARAKADISQVPPSRPRPFYQRYLTYRYWHRVLQRVGTTLLVIYIAIPLWFYACPWLRRQCVFLHNFNWPPFAPTNLSDPALWNQINTKPFYLDSETGIRLGAWHIFPSSQKKNFTQLDPDGYFNDSRPVIIYCHGNSMNRAALYRLDLYHILRNSPIDAHVITFDYRGFGDSTYLSPSVQALVKDAEAVYNWVQRWVPKSRIFIWGHSLGSGVTIQLADRLSREESPAATILESPFTNIPDATKTFPLSVAHRLLPFFDTFFAEPTRHGDTNFNSDQKIRNVKCPVMILHATDDDMVGVELGRRLHSIAVSEQGAEFPRAKFVEFDAKLGLGHLWLSHNPELPAIAASFMAQYCRECNQ